jgi:hypothetical protein
MRIVYLALFLVMGIAFILVSTVFYPAITDSLNSTRVQMGDRFPDFWDLPLVLSIVRIIFLIAGSLIIVSGIAFYWLKGRQAE